MSGPGPAPRSASRERCAALRRDFLGDRRLGQPALARLEGEREFERVFLAVPLEVSDQGPGDAELAVGLEMRVAGVVDLRGDGLEARLVDQEVEVRRAEVVPLLGTQQRAGRSDSQFGVT